MKLFLLGAGKPEHGDKPSALKHISDSTTVLDWKLHSFESIVPKKETYFLGGYHVQEVIERYPELNFSIVPNWQQKNILHTLFSAPLSNTEAIVSYADTIFRTDVIKRLLEVKADIVYGVDTLWRERFDARSLEDITKAETLTLNGVEVEFTGLIYLSKRATQIISKLHISEVGTNLIDLILFLQKSGLTTASYDVKAQWAEFNSPNDITKFILGTKAETLARLEPLVKKSHIGKQVSFTAKEWQEKSSLIIKNILSTFKEQNLVVRSSSKGEDNWESSNAGGFESVLNVDISNTDAIISAIESVIHSYGDASASDDQVLVQAFLSSVASSGVVFTCGLESGSPYYRINFDDVTESTESVTAGTHGDLRTIIISRIDTDSLSSVESKLVPLLDAVIELEQLLGFDKLDIEFAIDKTGRVYIFQVRPITVNHSKYDLEIKTIQKSLTTSKNTFINQQKTSPFLFAQESILANMPDWNPAEIIGTRPKPLAFSLYREIITDSVWAKQRSEFGYCDISPHPLILSLSGQPYVDTKASFNSFIPDSLEDSLKEKLVNTYISILKENPQLHDKIEFEIAYTIWTPDFLSHATKRLSPYGISKDEIKSLELALKKITNKALLRLESDISSIKKLQNRRIKVLNSDISALDKSFILLDDCKEFGTLAFSHAARAGFVATTFLNSFIENSIFSQERKNEFLMSFKTVAGEFEEDKYLYSIGKISLENLTHKYGHLRPGTYELKTEAYWENPKQYLIPQDTKKPKKYNKFFLSQSEKVNFEDILIQLGSNISANKLLKYFEEAIQAREEVKFEFTKNLSKALDLIVEAGVTLGLKRKSLSYLEYSDLKQLKLNVLSLKDMKKRIKRRKKNFQITQAIELPNLIKNISDFYCFERLSSEPNFVTAKKAEALIYKFNENKNEDMSGKIIMIEQADPGYDWLFSHKIAGLITLYGGANSHMAIRAAEIGLPSAIGVGEKLYDKITLMRRVELDCSNQTIREIL